MKRLVIFYAFFATLALTCVSAQQAAVELSFTYTKQSGSGSNQFAVWIEDSQGDHVKTLYATRFTANGGWKRRATSIPQWVKQSGLSGMTQSQIDAFSGATPKAGNLTYRWDGTNSRGTALPPGEYVIFLEGTLRGESQVLYRAPVQIGQGSGPAEVVVEYTGTAAAEREMISAVTVRVLR